MKSSPQKDSPWQYKSLVAIEQEFNSETYGIKGIIDGTIKIKNRNSKDGEDILAALEIKTGKSH